MELEELSITPFTYDDTDSNWLKMVTTSSKLSNGRTLLRNTFDWKRVPNIALTDVFAITHSSSAVQVPNTIFFNYYFTRNGQTYNGGNSGRDLGSDGIAYKFKVNNRGEQTSPITAKCPTDHRGAMQFQVEKENTNDTTANAYGHYSHTTIGVTGTVSIYPGRITIGGVRTETKQPDTIIRFNY